MLKLNVNQEKQLTFEVQIGGVQSDQVKSHLRVEIDNIEYGFPAVVGQESITVDLPALKTVTSRKLKEGEEANIKLEIVADGTYLVAWQDTFRLSNPVIVEAKIVDDDFQKATTFKPKITSTSGKSGDQSQGIRLEKVETPVMDDEDALTERIVNKLAEKLSEGEGVEEFIKRPAAGRAQGGFGSIKGKTAQGGFGSVKGREQSKKLPAFREEDDDMADEVNDNESGEEVEEFIKRPSASRPQGGFGSIKGKTAQGGFGSVKGKERPLPRRESSITPEDVMNIDEEGVYAYMERAGTKNPTIQKIIYEKAEAAAGSSLPVKVLQQVVKFMKSKK